MLHIYTIIYINIRWISKDFEIEEFFLSTLINLVEEEDMVDSTSGKVN
jgi:hypothetical protein